jgi:REP element-mobilizing transposase RayT
MGDSIVRNSIHIVFATSSRRPFLRDDALRENLWAFIAGLCREKQCEVIEVGGWVDHAHVAIYLSPKIALADLVRELKKSATKHVNDSLGCARRFSWQRGYAAMSVSHSHVRALRRYIAKQPEHHRERDFLEEWKVVLGKNGIKDEHLQFE